MCVELTFVPRMGNSAKTVSVTFEPECLSEGIGSSHILDLSRLPGLVA